MPGNRPSPVADKRVLTEVGFGHSGAESCLSENGPEADVVAAASKVHLMGHPQSRHPRPLSECLQMRPQAGRLGQTLALPKADGVDGSRSR